MLQIYKASAGSGKTYKLAYEYIRALLGVKSPETQKYSLCLPKYTHNIADTNNRHRYILAITFTNKATEEMKRRITDELDALAFMPQPGGKDASYAEGLCREFGCRRDELAMVAERSLKQLLNDYSAFNVTTIDSFFQRVLRTFARELDRQGDFNVELNDKAAVQAAVCDMIDDFNADMNAHPQLAKWIYDYLYNQLQQGGKTNFFNRSSNLHKNLVTLLSHICDEQFKPYYRDMQIALQDTANLDTIKKEIKKIRVEILERVKTESERLWADLATKGATTEGLGVKSIIRKLFEKYFIPGKEALEKDITSDTYEKAINGLSDIFTKKSKIDPALGTPVIETLRRIRPIYVNYFILGDIYDSVDQLILLSQAWSYMHEFVSKNNLVLLSDTNHLLSQIIGEDETPFIYERMGVQFRHFLIDEFQDTSKMQWSNLRPLVATGLDMGNDSLIIGDEKQSIYRFRNSDSSLLHTQVAEVDFPVPHYDTKIAGGAPGENTNYRSAGDIVRFNNTLFARLAANCHIEGFENVVQDIPEKFRSMPGYVKFTPVEKGGTPLDALAENILRQHNEGGYRWNDIAILVDRHQEGGQVVEHFINHYPEIPLVSDDSLYLRKSPAIQLVVGALEILANRKPNREKSADQESKIKYASSAEVAQIISRFCYFHGQGMDTEEALRLAYDLNDTKVNDQNARLTHSVESIVQHKPSSTPALVETIIHELVPDHLRKSQSSFLTAFQDYVMEYSKYNNPSLRSLLNNWNSIKHKLSVSGAAHADAVTIMTIHKSKGLEFPCVHIPYGSWSESGKEGAMWLPFPHIEGLDSEICPPAIYIDFHKSTKCHAIPGSYFHDEYIYDEKWRHSDIMNKTYVAYTRAGRELMVYYDPGKEMGARVAEVFADTTLASPDDYRLCDIPNHYDISTCTFTLGEPTQKIAEKATKGTVETMAIDGYPIHLHDGAKVLTTVEDMLELDDDITDVPTESADTYEIDEAARLRGITLHDILSHIETYADIDEAVKRVATEQRMTQSEIKDIKAAVMEMLNPEDARIRRWFIEPEDVLTEQTIYIPTSAADSGENNKRPDRIVFGADGSVEVIDYKFTSEARRSHHRQIEGYMRLLSEMGYENIRGYLWYPFLQKIIEVS